MNNENDILIEDLRKKIGMLIQKHESVLAELKKLKSENLELKDSVSLKENKLNELETKINTIKLANTVFASAEEKKEAKTRINRIVREIDKCIALLNK
ncbi:MAG: hypothetical protein A2W91_03345 [Bacteroidetes bacterium GWF2_38_335]|nr:MAG: hypothetical protein A2W91_03345 [Bacteroidetes bacterium GWF2_38_335]OFY77479.1 MAG: hypothetical protein A2281_01415 [Bacteroidetes bacterium RIFOXYA12_FULL_38_20]HBS87229.1 hypothetical protein [Bacteroidales bacterium]